VFNFLKRKGKAQMLTKEQIEQLTPEQKADLLALLQPIVQSTESQTATIETTVGVVPDVEAPVVQEPIIEQAPQVVPQPQVDFDSKFAEITKTFDDKFNGVVEALAKKLEEKDSSIEAMKAEILELKRTAPTMVAQPIITNPTLETPRDMEQKKALNSWFNSPSSQYVNAGKK